MVQTLNELFRSYYEQVSERKPYNAQKILIFSVERHLVQKRSRSVGGLADRLKGAVAAFYLAVVTGRRFAIHWESPFPVDHNFYSPNIDWSLGSVMSHLQSGVPILHLDMLNQTSTVFDQLSPDRVEDEIFLGHRIVVLNINSYREKALLPYFRDLVEEPLNYATFFARAFQFLFRFVEHSEFEESRLSLRNCCQQSDGLFGVHLRTGSGNGWHDPVMDDWQNYDKLLRYAFQVAEDQGSRSPTFYFLSDSADARAAVAAADWPHPVLVDLHKPVHIDRGENVSQFENDLTFHEFQMLSETQSVICGKGGFALMATLLGGKTLHRYV